mgnify:CR=1 FL=1
MSLQIVSKKEVSPPKYFDEPPYWEVSIVVDGLYPIMCSAPLDVGANDATLQKYLSNRYEDIRRSALEVLRLTVRDELAEMWKDIKELKTKA